MKTLAVSGGDWYTDSRGRFLWLTGRQALEQNVADTLLQDLNEDEDWGNRINRTRLPSILGPLGSHEGYIQVEVSEALDRLRSKQDESGKETDLTALLGSYSVTVAKASEPLKYYYYVEASSQNPNSPLIENGYALDLRHTQDPTLR